MDDLDDYCYECTGYGNDYYVDEDGETISYCPDCPHNPSRRYREEWEE